MLAFWLAYILTRPLGASIGDYLSQPTQTAAWGSGRRARASSSSRDPRPGRVPDGHAPRRPPRWSKRNSARRRPDRWTSRCCTGSMVLPARHDLFEDLWLGVVAQDAEFIFIGLLAAMFLATPGHWASPNARRGVVARRPRAAALGAPRSPRHPTISGTGRGPLRPNSSKSTCSSRTGETRPSPVTMRPQDSRSRSRCYSALAASERSLSAWPSHMAMARVAMGIHYPSDVIAGAVLGAGAALAVHAALRCPPLRNGAPA